MIYLEKVLFLEHGKPDWNYKYLRIIRARECNQCMLRSTNHALRELGGGGGWTPGPTFFYELGSNLRESNAYHFVIVIAQQYDITLTKEEVTHQPPSPTPSGYVLFCGSAPVIFWKYLSQLHWLFVLQFADTLLIQWCCI